MSINKNIKQLVNYALSNNLIDDHDFDYAVNKICYLLNINSYSNEAVEEVEVSEPTELLKPLLDYAVENQIIEIDTIVNRDLFESLIMDIFTYHPSVINNKFYDLYKTDKKSATNYFYDISKKLNYIKTSRTDKNITFSSETEYGKIDLTINLSKPEKDPRDIIAQKNKISTNYPQCFLCKENVGFYGSATQPPRTNHRIIKLDLNSEEFYFQYSPYVYYNEHSIILKKEHEPMNVSIKTFNRLFDFVEQFPHYFLGSNAGLPIVGGSILSHEHYQGGNNKFPIESAKVLNQYNLGDVLLEKLKWPINVLRLSSTNRKSITDIALKLYSFFEGYSDKNALLISKTDELHNAITPIARYQDGLYILDIALRNNLTNEQFPLGYFHTHPENYHIKKENIGLIEVLGLAVLPARLKEELEDVKNAVSNKISISGIHYEWVEYLNSIYQGENINQFINDQVAIKFVSCLEDAGIFKNTEKGNNQYNNFINQFIKTI